MSLFTDGPEDQDSYVGPMMFLLIVFAASAVGVALVVKHQRGKSRLTCPPNYTLQYVKQLNQKMCVGAAVRPTINPNLPAEKN